MAKGRVPWALMVAGHPRSGTTMLVQLCNTHPEIRVANEYRAFLSLGRPLPIYARTLHRPRRYDLVPRSGRAPKHPALRNLDLHMRFVARLLPHARRVELEHVTKALAALWPSTRVVGDKVPRYLKLMRRVAGHERLKRVVIYRDCRDVVQSTLARAERDWGDARWVASGDVAAVTGHWLKAMRRVEGLDNGVHVIRYEDFVADPVAGAGALANYLGVDTSGFDTSVIRRSSAGKWRQALTGEQVAAIEAAAGERLAAWGYGR